MHCSAVWGSSPAWLQPPFLLLLRGPSRQHPRKWASAGGGGGGGHPLTRGTGGSDGDGRRGHGPQQLLLAAALVTAPSADAPPQHPDSATGDDARHADIIGPLSVSDTFDGASVLLTGATGYVGALVLEQLLRSTRVRRVYCLVRERAGSASSSGGKEASRSGNDGDGSSSSSDSSSDGSSHRATRGGGGANEAAAAAAAEAAAAPQRPCTAQERISAVLQSSLFEGLRASSSGGGGGRGGESDSLAIPWEQLRAKVVPVAGQLSAPRCGLSSTDEAALVAEVSYVIHCAASIKFGGGCHELLRCNYTGTAELAGGLAARMPNLRGMVHVSTAYVNGNLPRGAVVEEKSYPLPPLTNSAGGGRGSGGDGGGNKTQASPPRHAELVGELLSLPEKEANARACQYVSRLGYPNLYCLSKRMAEDYLTDLAAGRETGVACTAAEPSPAEEAAAAAAGGVRAKVPLASISAADAGAGPFHPQKQHSESNRQLQQQQHSNPIRQQQQQRRRRPATADSQCSSRTHHTVGASPPPPPPPLALFPQGSMAGPLPVAIVRPTVIGAVSAEGPCPGYVGNRSGATGAVLAIATGLARYSAWLPGSVLDVVPGERVAGAVLLAAAQLHASAQQRPQQQQQWEQSGKAVGQRSGQAAPCSATGAARRPPIKAPAAAAAAAATAAAPMAAATPPPPRHHHQQSPAGPLIVHVGGSCAPVPLTNRAFYSAVTSHFEHRPPRHRLHTGPYPSFDTGSTDTSALGRAMRNLKGDVRVAGAAALLWLAGKGRSAGRLAGAWDLWKTVNTPDLDFDLRFDCTTARALQAALPTAEARQLGLHAVWQPESELEWRGYLDTYMWGVRQHCLREREGEEQGAAAATAAAHRCAASSLARSPASAAGRASPGAASVSAAAADARAPLSCVPASLAVAEGGKGVQQ